MSSTKRVLTYINEETRPATGALQFSGDWPGLFVRGDSAIYVAASIRLLQAHFEGIDLGAHVKLFDAAELDPSSTLSDDEIRRLVQRVGRLADIVERDVLVDAKEPPEPRPT